MGVFIIPDRAADGAIITGQLSAFAAKSIGDKKLYKREHGKTFQVQAGSTDCIFTIPYPWVKITGIEIIGGEFGDTCDLMILDSASGTYSTIPNYKLNQFGFDVNVAPGEYEEANQYEADIYQGMQIKIVYKSISAKTIAVNYNLHEVK